MQLTRARRLVVWVVTPVLGLLTLVAWGISSPVGSSPDDDFHLASIWCGVGERDGLCERGSADDERLIPDGLVSAACFAYEPDESAECQGDALETGSGELDSTDRGNFAGLYPPVFYFATGIFASDDLPGSVVLIRALNGVLFVGLLTALAALLPSYRRRPAIMAVLLTSVPLGLFLIASTNPSSWALVSASVVLPALVGYFEASGRRRIALGALATIGVVVGAGARADSAVFAAISCTAAIAICSRLGRRILIPALLPLALIGIAAAAYLTAGQSSASVVGLSGTPPLTLAYAFELLKRNLLDVPSLWVGALGGWGLGWLDTPLPAVVAIGGTVVLGAGLLWGLLHLDRRGALVTIALVALAWAFPTYLLIQSQAVVGGYVQPRYVLPLLMLVAFAALSGTGRVSIPRPWIVVGIGILAASNSIALHTNLRRYTFGLDRLKLNLDSGPEWWWAAGPSPMTVWIIGTVAFTALLVLLAASQWRQQVPTQASGPVGMRAAN